MQRLRFRDYCKRFGAALWADAAPWARDTLMWGALMVVVPPIAAYLRDSSHQIDWLMVRTALWLYLGALMVYLLVHLARTAWKLDCIRAEQARSDALQHSPKQGSTGTEWKRLSRDFDKLPEQITISWSYTTGGGKGVQEWGSMPNARCEQLCIQGGLMLLGLPALRKAMCKQAPGETEPLRLWLQCLKEVRGGRWGIERDQMLRAQRENGTWETILSGRLTMLAQRSADLCLACANWELRQGIGSGPLRGTHRS